MKKIVVVGSFMVDVAAYTACFPINGQTVLGTDSKLSQGGKGSNQAVAAKRAGAQVYMVAKVGVDTLSDYLFELYKNENMSTDYISRSDKNTGMAIITVNTVSGENRIIVIKGANQDLSSDDVLHAGERIKECDIVLTQLETEISAVMESARLANENKKIFILNPAPPCAIPDELYRYIDFFTPNETEAEAFTGIHIESENDAEETADILINKGVKNVIITLGKKGAFYKGTQGKFMVNAKLVDAVDTTGAGDAFNGAFAVRYAECGNVREAMEFATVTSSIAVTRQGAAQAMPYRKEIEEKML